VVASARGLRSLILTADDDAPIAAPATAEEVALVEALRRGDEKAFASLIDRYHSSLLRLAMSYVATKEAAEDVVQETWMGVLSGIDRFEGRSSLKTWIFRILVNRAKTKGLRERRSVPFSSLEADDDGNPPSVDPSRFQEGTRQPGAWSAPPQSWEGIPEDRLLSGETRAVVEAAIAVLPAMQRAVITLRDVRGFTAQEACEVLGLTEANQRVLLHRARSKVRARLEEYLGSSASRRGQAGK
jgi:RNA polymerase sigma-70 factor (ECF subfamily)